MLGEIIRFHIIWLFNMRMSKLDKKATPWFTSMGINIMMGREASIPHLLELLDEGVTNDEGTLLYPYSQNSFLKGPILDVNIQKFIPKLAN